MIQRDRHLNTPIGDMAVLVAQQSDIVDVRSLIEEAGKWLRSRGIYQWTPGKPASQRLNWLIKQQWLYMVYLDERTAATITLQTHNHAIWGKN